MDTEALAVTAVKSAIAKTNYLTDYIKDKDKEPMWDGAIYAYNSESKRNSDWYGKAAVQIKGKNVNGLERQELKYNIDVVDLKNYKKDGGLLFFVVAIDREGETLIYYKALTPFLINRLLDSKEDQKTVSTSFSIFPKKANEICNVVKDFIRDSRKQELFTHEKIPTLQDFLETAGKDISYGFQCSGIGYNQNVPFEYFFEHELYMYATNTKLNINFPIEHISKIEKVAQSVEATIKIKDKIYYENYDVVYKNNGFELYVGNSIVIDIDTIKNKAKINYKLKGNIKEQIRDIQFVADFLEFKETSINGVKFPISPTAKEIESFHIKESLELQERLVIIDDMLTSLNVRTPLEIDNISKKEEDYLKMLVMSFVDKKPVSFKEKNIPPVGTISIGNISLVLYFRKTEKGDYIIENFSDVDIDVSGEYENGSMFKTSKYVILKAEDIIKVSNCTCKQIVDELMTIENDGHYLDSNLVLLELLKVFDITKNQSILDEAVRLAQWLKKAECLAGISIINYYQCIKRHRLLSEQEEDEIINLLEEFKDSEEIRAGAYILLENYKMAKRCYDKLDSEEQEAFKLYPIYKLMK